MSKISAQESILITFIWGNDEFLTVNRPIDYQEGPEYIYIVSEEFRYQIPKEGLKYVAAKKKPKE
jgi:hypothetical protein